MGIIIIWDGVRLFRYSGPVKGNFTSHDSGELPHICFYTLCLSRSGYYGLACIKKMYLNL